MAQSSARLSCFKIPVETFTSPYYNLKRDNRLESNPDAFLEFLTVRRNLRSKRQDLQAREILSVVTLLYSAFNISLSRFSSHVVPLVVKLFALAQTHLHLYHRPFEIHGYRYQSKSLLLDLAEKLHDLLFVHKQPADSHRIAVENISMIVRRNMHTLDPKLSVVNRAPAVLEIHTSAAY